jgi:uncharacterized membrane protein HdeD (DUF308 family)
MASEAMTANVFDGIGDSIRSYRSWVVVAGITSLVLGVAAMIYNGTATIASVTVFGGLLMFVGAVQIVHAFQVRTWSGFFLYLLDGIIRAVVGTLMVMYPTSGAEALTLLLGFYFIVAGVFRAIASVVLQFPSWGWTMASGLLSVTLGALLAVEWPASGQWFIGFAVGLDLILYGWALLMFAAAVKRLSPTYA